MVRSVNAWLQHPRAVKTWWLVIGIVAFWPTSCFPGYICTPWTCRKFTVKSIDKSTVVVRSLLGPSDISLNQIHALSVREINYYTIAKIVILPPINIVYVPRPVSNFQIVHSDFSDICESHDTVLKDLGICLRSAAVATVMPISTANCGKRAPRQF